MITIPVIILSIIVIILIWANVLLVVDYEYFWKKSYKIYMANFGTPPTTSFSGIYCWRKCKKKGLL
jgi:hypothetical protein